MTESNKMELTTSQSTFNIGHPKIAIEELEIDDRIYPRKRRSPKTIESYTESLKCGAKFPPILIQKVSDEGEKRTLILDGFHRTKAYEEFGEEKIPYESWKNQRIPFQENIHKLRVVSIKRNLTHGDRLANKDKKVMCKQMAREDEDLKITQKEFSDIFNVAQSTIHNWVSDIRARQKGSRNNTIIRLSKLGWTQKAIAEKVDITQQRVQQITNNIKFDKICDSYFEDNKTIPELVEFYGYDTQVIWSILLEEKTDRERFNLFFKESSKECKWELYNIWNFPNRDDRLGIEADGNIAGQIPMNLLYYYTDQGDLVLDPMAGGGSTIDACLVLGRECIAYDIKPKREGILQNDSVQNIPEFITSKKTADFVFIDPPYYDMVSGIQDYEDIEDFYNQMKSLFTNTLSNLKIGGYIAVLIGQLAPTIKQDTNLSAEIYNILRELGLNYINRISVPHSTQQASPQAVIKYKKIKQLLTRDRVLWIFQKNNGGKHQIE
jgi:transcriptional regulator with XRE-family HTH domain